MAVRYLRDGIQRSVCGRTLVYTSLPARTVVSTNLSIDRSGGRGWHAFRPIWSPVRKSAASRLLRSTSFCHSLVADSKSPDVAQRGYAVLSICGINGSPYSHCVLPSTWMARLHAIPSLDTIAARVDLVTNAAIAAANRC